MNIHSRALLVHLFTATGAIFAMLAMLAAADERWDMMFLWLVVAFFVDGIDGPLARKYDVKTNAPEFDGVLLDLIIDYLTYVPFRPHGRVERLGHDHHRHLRQRHVFLRHTHENQG